VCCCRPTLQCTRQASRAGPSPTSHQVRRKGKAGWD
jgi:hypothetical protein